MGLFTRLVMAFKLHDQEYDDRHLAILRAIKQAKEDIMADLDDRLSALNTKLDEIGTALSDTVVPEIAKIAGETDGLKAALQAIVDNPPGGITPEQSAAINTALEKANTIGGSVTAIKEALMAIDQKVPDSPPA